MSHNRTEKSHIPCVQMIVSQLQAATTYVATTTTTKKSISSLLPQAHLSIKLQREGCSLWSVYLLNLFLPTSPPLKLVPLSSGPDKLEGISYISLPTINLVHVTKTQEL